MFDKKDREISELLFVLVFLDCSTNGFLFLLKLCKRLQKMLLYLNNSFGTAQEMITETIRRACKNVSKYLQTKRLTSQWHHYHQFRIKIQV